jgi:hypothetical protein
MIHDTVESLLKCWCTEIDHQTNLQLEDLQISEQLFMMNWRKGLTGFSLNNYLVLNQQIYPKSIVNYYTVISK